jgi:hypothetical protein
VNTHAPWYNTNSAHQGDGEAQRKSLEHLLYDAGVDAVFTGHVHACKFRRKTTPRTKKARPQNKP